MRTTVPPNSAHGQGAGRQSPAQFLDVLRRGALARLLPLPTEARSAAEAELGKLIAAGQPGLQVEDDFTNLLILRGHATLYDRRWQERLGQGFNGWPQAETQRAAEDPYALVSEDELQSQLVGQPVIEALDRRFVDVLDVIDSRLWSLAVELGAQSRPVNPVGSRAIIEAFLDTFPASECSTALRQVLLRHLERLAGEHLGEFYTWCNVQLAEAGFAIGRVGDFSMLMASPLAGVVQTGAPLGDGDRREVWSQDNAVAATGSTWREGKRGTRRSTDAGSHDAQRGNALRGHVRAVRSDRQGAVADAQARELRDEEFLAVLSLLQGDADAMRGLAAGSPGVGTRLREQLRQGAARLGMEPAHTAFSGGQEDAIDLTGLVFDRLLLAHALDAEARTLLQRLCCPYLHLALSDPYLFDEPAHPAQALLSLLLELWDGNDGASEHDAEIRALAEESADDVIADYHGEAAVFDQALAALQAALEPRRQRAAIAERRAWQSIQGRERLQSARREADSALQARLQGRRLLDSVGGFLCDQWRQSLIHAWLREGSQSERFLAALAVGDAIVSIDEAAAQAQGREVAAGLIALEQPLRQCYVACGLDEGGANDLLARLVAELAQPDALRSPQPMTPLAEPVDADAPPEAGTEATAMATLSNGQWLVATEPGQPPLALRVAWISPLSAMHLLVNRQGAHHAFRSLQALGAWQAKGWITPRPVEGAVEAVLCELVEAATAAALVAPTR